MCNPKILGALTAGAQPQQQPAAPQQMAAAGDVRDGPNGPEESGGYVHFDPRTGEPAEDPARMGSYPYIAPGKDPARKEYWRPVKPVS